MSLVKVINCGAGNALHSFEISMFWIFVKLYFIYISTDILPLRAQNAIKQCKWYISRKLQYQVLRKWVNLPPSKAAQLPLISFMISKNSDFWEGGNVKFFVFFYRSEFYTHEHKNQHSVPENYPLTICIQINDFFFIIIKSVTKSCPWWKSGKASQKIEISLSQLLIIRDIQNLHLDICFVDDKYDEIN